MFDNFFKIAFRSFLRNKIITSINVSSLAVGLASCLLIMLYVSDELNFDKFHKQYDRIFRITEERSLTETPRYFATSNAPLVSLIENEFPQIKAVRFFPSKGLWSNENMGKVVENDFYYSDSTVFSVFDFDLLEGNPLQALSNPFSVVITEKIANKLFGNTNALGKIIALDSKFNFVVTGILKEIPENSHLKFNILASFSTVSKEVNNFDSWWGNAMYSYLLLPDEFLKNDFVQYFPAFVNKLTNNRFEGKRRFSLQPLSSIHLYSDLEGEARTNSSIDYIYIFSGIALFILLIGCLNFMNLSTARSLKRAKEVALRKVMGAKRINIQSQFLAEAVLLALISFFIAIVLLEIFLPHFNNIASKNLSLSVIYQPINALILISGTIILGILSGLYPALILSNFSPVEVFRKNVRSHFSRFGIRKLLVIIQFSIAGALIILTLFMERQYFFLQNKKLGFNQKRVLVVPVKNNLTEQQCYFLKNELMQEKIVLSCSFSENVPGYEIKTELPYFSENKKETDTILPNILILRTDSSFIETYEIETKKQKNSDSTENNFLINEAAQRVLDWNKKNTNNITIAIPKEDTVSIVRGNIAGVVRNFHYNTLHHKIEPLLIYNVSDPTYFNYLSIKFSVQALNNKQIGIIKKVWEKHIPNQQFTYNVLYQKFNGLYKAELKASKVVRSFAILAILIACIGLYGLTALSSEQKIKEVGIRRVLGANSFQMLISINGSFVILIAVSQLVAFPFVILFVEKWLSSFAYSIDISYIEFLVSYGIILLISILTISGQAVNIVLKKPLEALKYE